jgi:hypothetical protein
LGEAAPQQQQQQQQQVARQQQVAAVNTRIMQTLQLAFNLPLAMKAAAVDRAHDNVDILHLQQQRRCTLPATN